MCPLGRDAEFVDSPGKSIRGRPTVGRPCSETFCGSKDTTPQGHDQEPSAIDALRGAFQDVIASTTRATATVYSSPFNAIWTRANW